MRSPFSVLRRLFGASEAAHTPDSPSAAGADSLEAAEDDEGPPLATRLVLARRAMDEADELLARRAFKTYALAVTRAFEERPPGFEPRDWLAQTADDPHPDVQQLRAGLGARFEQAARAKDVSALEAQYRAEVFREARPSAVQLATTREHALAGGELRLAPGLHDAVLSGTFDNAQDAVQEGWTLRLELEDEAGAAWCIEARWDAQELFAALLDARHDAGRVRLDEVPDALRQALGQEPFVGPIVTYGDAWDELAPAIDGEALQLAGEQLLCALIALLRGDGRGTRLCFLVHGAQVIDEDGERDEAPPFVSLASIEDLVLGDGAERSCCRAG